MAEVFGGWGKVGEQPEFRLKAGMRPIAFHRSPKEWVAAAFFAKGSGGALAGAGIGVGSQHPCFQRLKKLAKVSVPVQQMN